MKKIKVFLGTMALVSVLGITSYAAVTNGVNGTQKLEGSETVDVVNNNADVLGAHIGEIANADTLGHIKIGSGIVIDETGKASVKIVNDLETNDSETALSAAMGVELSDDIADINNLLDREGDDFDIYGVWSGVNSEQWLWGVIPYFNADKYNFEIVSINSNGTVIPIDKCNITKTRDSLLVQTNYMYSTLATKGFVLTLNVTAK